MHAFVFKSNHTCQAEGSLKQLVLHRESVRALEGHFAVDIAGGQCGHQGAGRCPPHLPPLYVKPLLQVLHSACNANRDVSKLISLRKHF